MKIKYFPLFFVPITISPFLLTSCNSSSYDFSIDHVMVAYARKELEPAISIWSTNKKNWIRKIEQNNGRVQHFIGRSILLLEDKDPIDSIEELFKAAEEGQQDAIIRLSIEFNQVFADIISMNSDKYHIDFFDDIFVKVNKKTSGSDSETYVETNAIVSTKFGIFKAFVVAFDLIFSDIDDQASCSYKKNFYNFVLLPDSIDLA